MMLAQLVGKHVNMAFWYYIHKSNIFVGILTHNYTEYPDDVTAVFLWQIYGNSILSKMQSLT